MLFTFFSLIMCSEALQNIHIIFACVSVINIRVSKKLFGFGVGFFFSFFFKNGTESLMEILVSRKSSEESGYQKS